jgi:hypothetical protein
MQLRRAKWLALAVTGGATVIVACSSASSIETGGSFGRAGGVGPVGSASAPTEGAPPRCPPDPPAIGSSSIGFATICTYGPDTRDECVEKYEADENERWQNATGSCPVQCPASFFDITPGTACGDSEMACSFEDGTCGCFHDGPLPKIDAGSGDAASSSDAATDGGDGGKDAGKDGGFTRPLVPGVWKCVAPPTDVACPSARPRAVDACVKAVTCDYGTCELGQDLSYDCTQGIWQPSFNPPSCP